MEGDDLLLAEMDAKAAPKRDEWMTTLPPERKVSYLYSYLKCKKLYAPCNSTVFLNYINCFTERH